MADAVGEPVGLDPFGLEQLDPRQLRGRPDLKWADAGEAELAAWVADMDFPLPPVVRSALTALLENGDLGYPAWLYEEPLEASFV
ncbi:MAG: hypothetical protein ACR2MA_06700 [Egibacteraceae bacterium]